MKMIWRKGTIPQEWKTNIMVPLYKRGKKRTENYRGIPLLCTAYKIYIGIIRNMIEEEVEAKKMVPKSQTDFRKGRSAVDNIFVTII